jgi:hypothetical protein
MTLAMSDMSECARRCLARAEAVVAAAELELAVALPLVEAFSFSLAA